MDEYAKKVTIQVKVDKMQEERNVTGVLCSSYDVFFEAEKKIADFVLEHKEKVIDMTVAELAQASGTSDATVSRFCRKCGFKGFHHLKMRLTREVAEEQQQDVQVSNDISLEDIPQTLQNILANKVAELTQTVAMMNVDHLRAILKKIRSARMVQLAAVGNTIPVAMDGAFKFNQIGIPAVSGTILETQMAYAFNLGPEDVVLIISNSGHSRRLLKLAEGAKENGAAVIAITNNPDSPVARVSDYHITTATREKLLMEEFCFSRVASVAVMEMLYLLLSAGEKSSYDSIRRHEEAISDDKL